MARGGPARAAAAHRPRFWPALRQAHAWAGLVACLFLCTTGLTGATLVFKDAWLRATVPGARQPAVTDAARLAAAALAAEQALGSQALRSITFGSARFGLHELSLRDGGGAWMDPGTLAIVERWPRGGRLSERVLELHHTWLLGDAGEAAVGAVALLAVGLAASGIAYWARLRFNGARAWPRDRSVRELDAAHRTWGLVLAGPLVLMLLTGAGMALPGLAMPVLGVVTGEAAVEPPVPRWSDAAGPVAWQAGIAAAQAAFPGAAVRIAVWPGATSAPFLRLQQAAEWHANGRTRVWFDPSTGAVLARRDAVGMQRAARAYDLFWPVHASRVGGVAWQVGTVVIGVGLAALSALGALAYARRARRRGP